MLFHLRNDLLAQSRIGSEIDPSGNVRTADIQFQSRDAVGRIEFFGKKGALIDLLRGKTDDNRGARSAKPREFFR